MTIPPKYKEFRPTGTASYGQLPATKHSSTMAPWLVPVACYDTKSWRPSAQFDPRAEASRSKSIGAAMKNMLGDIFMVWIYIPLKNIYIIYVHHPHHQHHHQQHHQHHHQQHHHQVVEQLSPTFEELLFEKYIFTTWKVSLSRQINHKLTTYSTLF